MRRVLAVAPEIYPLIKTGGLADVVGALPRALAGHEVEMRVLVPGYPAVMIATADFARLEDYPDLFGGPARLLGGRAGELDILVLDAPHLYDRTGNPYVGPDGKDWPDNWRRFAALSVVAADIGAGNIPAFVPSLVHLHDWQSGLAAAYLRYAREPRARTLVTIHNLAFQGHFPAEIFGELGLPSAAYSIDGVEYFGGVGFLKAGLYYSDLVTTVSPTYAEEIQTPEGGMGLGGLLSGRRGSLFGILNGIDTEVWDPSADSHLAVRYASGNLAPRARNKRELERRFGLNAGEGPLFSVISRLTGQKGIDLVVDNVGALVEAGGRLAVLGSGEAALEASLHEAVATHRGRVGLVTGYHEDLAHLLQGGADAILVPSRFEPCGLTQLCALRYGCVPVVTRVGGLADTVIDANEAALAAGVATGLQFFPPTAQEMGRALERTVHLFGDRAAWEAMQLRGMETDVSWTRSAQKYADLYDRLASRNVH